MRACCRPVRRRGLALGFQAFYIAMSVGVGVGAAMGALVGNALGAGHRPRARRLAAQGISFGLIAALLLAMAGLWYGPAVLKLVSEPGAYRDAGIRYYLLLSLALPGFLLAFTCNGILQAHGGRQIIPARPDGRIFCQYRVEPAVHLWGAGRRSGDGI